MSDKKLHIAQMRSPLGRVRGMGSAKQGSHHWWMQRVTSIALLPLMLWFTLSVATMGGISYAETIAWIGHPLNAALLLLTVGIAFHHTASGLQVLIEDYVADEWKRTAAVLLIKGACLLLAVLSAVAVLKIAI
ncbi:succinate dehydrogenase, hydrophobic membrane anchor protein [Pseudoroseomonas sp. WGS1072]|uniref:succinate dehydrogenase, hydrophobic membrane anchor protein n=1 Tax=Roseomonas sp. WGS1072 TaxID=3366816 RepID=UPI003BF09F54